MNIEMDACTYLCNKMNLPVVNFHVEICQHYDPDDDTGADDEVAEVITLAPMTYPQAKIAMLKYTNIPLRKTDTTRGGYRSGSLWILYDGHMQLYTPSFAEQSEAYRLLCIAHKVGMIDYEPFTLKQLADLIKV